MLSLTRHRRGQRVDRGETLIELLVTVAILGTAVVAVVGALAAAIKVSDLHRKHATAGAAVRAYAEALEGLVAQTPTGYLTCALASDYQSRVTFAAPAGYTAHVVDVTYWSGSAFAPSASCAAAGADHGVQLVTLRVDSPDNRVSESLDVVLRKPCRVVDSPCAP